MRFLKWVQVWVQAEQTVKKQEWLAGDSRPRTLSYIEIEISVKGIKNPPFGSAFCRLSVTFFCKNSFGHFRHFLA
jgi:hypothetical protein